MIKLNLKRVLVFLGILGLLVASLQTDLIYLRLILIGLIMLIVSLLIFLRNGSSKKFDTVDETEYENDLSENEEELTGQNEINNTILTEADILERQSKAKITQFVPNDLNAQYKKIANEEIPVSSSSDTQFNFFLEKTLDIIRNYFNAYSAIFFWYRKDKNQIIFYTFSSEEVAFQKLKYEVGTDIISKVILTGNPTYTCNINSNVEADLIKYYQTPIGIKSVAAVPVSFNNRLIGILAIDSKNEDAFGPETIYNLGKFVRLITFILGVYDQKYNIDIVNQKLDALLELIGNSTREYDENKLIQNFIVVLDKFVEWDALGIVLYNAEAKAYILRKVVCRVAVTYMGEGLPVEVNNETLIGHAITEGNSVKIDDASSNTYYLYRKNVFSDIKGSIMIVPISSAGRVTHGAFVLENLKKKKYFDDDVRLVEKVANYFAFQLDNLFNRNLLRKYLSIDLDTMLLNRQTFEKKVNEVAKITSGEKHIGLALISVDRVDKLIKKYSQKVIPKIAKHVAMRLNKEAEELMEIGRVDTLTFGVLFINREPTVDNIWCQKIMQKISNELIDYRDDKFGITVSIGYAGGTKNIRGETLFQAAEFALSKAIDDGGNKIRTYK